MTTSGVLAAVLLFVVGVALGALAMAHGRDRLAEHRRRTDDNGHLG